MPTLQTLAIGLTHFQMHSSPLAVLQGNHPYEYRVVRPDDYGLLFASGRRLDLCLNDGRESVILLEHEPVYTIGRLPDKSSLRPAQLPHPFFETNRGARQPTTDPVNCGLPTLDLRGATGPHCYLWNLEDLLIICSKFVSGGKVVGKTGVWVQDRKIASIGIGIRKWIMMRFRAQRCQRSERLSEHRSRGLSGVE
jgi:hypothetical protein